jgi:hypothetical protein
MKQVIAQLAPGAAALTTLYDCPAQHMAEVDSILVCNRSATAATFRIAVSLSGTAVANEQYHYYDFPIDGNDTFLAAIGITLRPGDILRVYASTANLSFNAHGDVIYPVPLR